MTEDARQIVGVSGVVFNAEGHILLIRTAQAGWELPGGRVERGEDFLTTADTKTWARLPARSDHGAVVAGNRCLSRFGHRALQGQGDWGNHAAATHVRRLQTR